MSTNPANELVLCIPRIARANWCIEDACTIKDEFVKEFGQCVVRVKVSRSRKWPDCAKVSVVLLVNSQRVKDLKNYITTGSMLLLPEPHWHCYLARPVPMLTSEDILVQADFMPPVIARQNAVCLPRWS
jgi:hypothetical protein